MLLKETRQDFRIKKIPHEDPKEDDTTRQPLVGR